MFQLSEHGEFASQSAIHGHSPCTSFSYETKEWKYITKLGIKQSLFSGCLGFNPEV